MKAPTKEQLNDPEYWVWKLLENPDRVGVETTEDGQFVKLHHIIKHGKDIIPDGYGHKIEIFDRPDQSTSEEHQIMSDDCLSAKIGEIGNQIHNLGCDHQNDEDLSDRLSKLSIALWDLAKHAPTVLAEPEWDGTGFPPVGTECEVVIAAQKPRTVCFVGIKSSGSVVIEGVDGEMKSYQRSQVDFRPIRTQTQIDRAQLIKTLTQLRGKTNNAVIADSILELGFRITKP